jgi:hypothetical protein
MMRKFNIVTLFILLVSISAYSQTNPPPPPAPTPPSPKEDFGKLLVSVGNSLLNKELDKPRNVH